MKIRFIKNAAGIGFAHVEGSEGEYPEAVCNELVETGYAVIVETNAEVVETAEASPVAETAEAKPKRQRKQ